MNNVERLKRIQGWLGAKKWNEYIGVESYGWSPDTVDAWIVGLGNDRPDSVFFKVGEYGQAWYQGHYADYRARFLAHGVGCVPYVFARPAFWESDAQVAARCAILSGGVCLDCEEQWLNNNTQLYWFIQRVRTLCGPAPVILVSGYGDPQTAVPGWDFGALSPADGYQPQWYLGYWDLYHTRGYQAAINWGDGQIYHQLVASGLGSDFPLQPAINVEGVVPSEIGAIAQYCLRWEAGVTVWEARDIMDLERKELRQACNATA